MEKAGAIGLFSCEKQRFPHCSASRSFLKFDGIRPASARILRENCSTFSEFLLVD